MMDKYGEYNEFDRRVREVEEGLSRLTLSATMHYDKSLHMEITKAYTSILRDLRSSQLNEEERNHFRILINDLLNESCVDIQIMLRNEHHNY